MILSLARWKKWKYPPFSTMFWGKFLNYLSPLPIIWNLYWRSDCKDIHYKDILFNVNVINGSQPFSYWHGLDPTIKYFSLKIFPGVLIIYSVNFEIWKLVIFLLLRLYLSIPRNKTGLHPSKVLEIFLVTKLGRSGVKFCGGLVFWGGSNLGLT